MYAMSELTDEQLKAIAAKARGTPVHDYKWPDDWNNAIDAEQELERRHKPLTEMG